MHFLVNASLSNSFLWKLFRYQRTERKQKLNTLICDGLVKGNNRFIVYTKNLNTQDVVFIDGKLSSRKTIFPIVKAGRKAKILAYNSVCKNWGNFPYNRGCSVERKCSIHISSEYIWTVYMYLCWYRWCAKKKFWHVFNRNERLVWCASACHSFRILKWMDGK